jgi:hypothetical protein
VYDEGWIGSVLPMTGLLGGAFSPIGWSVHYLEAPSEAVLADTVSLRAARIEVRVAEPYPSVLERLAPFQAPWTRELVLPCGPWTAYLNNGIDGGDPTAVGQAVARRLGVRHVMAEHTLRYGPGHQATQLWISGLEGKPPLMVEREISASATDGRWEWNTSGTPLPFEDIGRVLGTQDPRPVRPRDAAGLLERPRHPRRRRQRLR